MEPVHSVNSLFRLIACRPQLMARNLNIFESPSPTMLYVILVVIGWMLIFFFKSNPFFTLFWLSRLKSRTGPSFKQIEKSFYRGCFQPCFVEIGLVSLEGKNFITLHPIFTLTSLSSLWIVTDFRLNSFKTRSPRMRCTCTKFGW